MDAAVLLLLLLLRLLQCIAYSLRPLPENPCSGKPVLKSTKRVWPKMIASQRHQGPGGARGAITEAKYYTTSTPSPRQRDTGTDVHEVRPEQLGLAVATRAARRYTRRASPSQRPARRRNSPEPGRGSCQTESPEARRRPASRARRRPHNSPYILLGAFGPS